MSGRDTELVPTSKKQGNIKAQYSVDYDDHDDHDDEEKGNGPRAEEKKYTDQSPESCYENKLISRADFRFTLYSLFFMLVSIPYLLVYLHVRIRTSNTLEKDGDLEDQNTVFILAWFTIFLAACLTIMTPDAAKCQQIFHGVLWLLGGVFKLVGSGMAAQYECEDYDDDTKTPCMLAYFALDGWIIGLTAMMIGIDLFGHVGDDFRKRIVGYSLPVLLTAISFMIPLYEFEQEYASNYLEDTIDLFKFGSVLLMIASLAAMYTYLGLPYFGGPFYDNKFVTTIISIFFLFGITFSWIYPCLCLNDTKNGGACNWNCMHWAMTIYVLLSVVLCYDTQLLIT